VLFENAISPKRYVAILAYLEIGDSNQNTIRNVPNSVKTSQNPTPLIPPHTSLTKAGPW